MSTENTESMGRDKAGALSSAAIARRRLLLASLGKGTAVAAAVSVPMQSLAAVGTLAVIGPNDKRRCTISGVMSGVHSGETTAATCTGYSPGYYKTVSHWPLYNASSNPTASNPINGGSGTFNINTPFSTLFGSGSSDGLITCLVDTSSHQNEFHWTAALLNGTVGSPAVNFPYSAQEVIDLYKAGGTVRSNAYAFFTGYMEVHN